MILSQVDLEKTKHLTGIITQGAKDFGVVQFVSSFKVAYSDDGQTWNLVKDENTNTEKVCEPLLTTYSHYDSLIYWGSPTK